MASWSSAWMRRTSARTRAASPSGSDSPFPIVFDGPGGTTDPYGVTGFPETFVIDREGRVVEAFAGAVNGEEERAQLRSAIETALAS